MGLIRHSSGTAVWHATTRLDRTVSVPGESRNNVRARLAELARDLAEQTAEAGGTTVNDFEDHQFVHRTLVALGKRAQEAEEGVKRAGKELAHLRRSTASMRQRLHCAKLCGQGLARRCVTLEGEVRSAKAALAAQAAQHEAALDAQAQQNKAALAVADRRSTLYAIDAQAALDAARDAGERAVQELEGQTAATASLRARLWGLQRRGWAAIKRAEAAASDATARAAQREDEVRSAKAALAAQAEQYKSALAAQTAQHEATLAAQAQQNEAARAAAAERSLLDTIDAQAALDAARDAGERAVQELEGQKAALAAQATQHEAAWAAQAQQNEAALAAAAQRSVLDALDAQAALAAARDAGERAVQELEGQRAATAALQQRVRALKRQQRRDRAAAKRAASDAACRVAQLKAELARAKKAPVAPVAALDSPTSATSQTRAIAVAWDPESPRKEGASAPPPVVCLAARAGGASGPLGAAATPQGIQGMDSSASGFPAAAAASLQPGEAVTPPSSLSSRSSSSGSSSSGCHGEVVVEEPSASVRDLARAFEAGAFTKRAAAPAPKAEAEELALRYGSGVCGGGVAAAVRTLSPLGATAGAGVTRRSLAAAAFQAAKRCAWVPPLLCLTAVGAASEAATSAALGCAAAAHRLVLAFGA